MSRSLRRLMLEFRTRAEFLAAKVAPYAEPVASRAQRLAQHPHVALGLAILRPLGWLVILLAPFYHLRTLYDQAWAFLTSKGYFWAWQQAFP